MKTTVDVLKQLFDEMRDDELADCAKTLRRSRRSVARFGINGVVFVMPRRTLAGIATQAAKARRPQFAA